jgi:hypothetical protein
MKVVASKKRVLAGSRSEQGVESTQTLASATATQYPSFPTGPNSDGVVVFAGDMKGAEVIGARWDMSTLTTFTAADAKLQISPNGSDWTDVDGGVFTQKSAIGSETIIFDDADEPGASRFWRVELDMTGTPGTSEHFVELLYKQVGCKGKMAPPGYVDKNS